MILSNGYAHVSCCALRLRFLFSAGWLTAFVGFAVTIQNRYVAEIVIPEVYSGAVAERKDWPVFTCEFEGHVVVEGLASY